MYVRMPTCKASAGKYITFVASRSRFFDPRIVLKTNLVLKFTMYIQYVKQKYIIIIKTQLCV